ncbi:interleukin-1 receptor-like 1 [Nothobranchius furzeri]|uniref:interleukin-1 receptor-like 1 n=1 Tax=Nothobranchius furzeri TaxID=105023 RepID=UPI003904AF3E
MLNSTLLSPDVPNYTAVPYNITWYNSKTGQEMSNQTGRILVLGETLWFLNTTLEDAGEYTTVLRTPLSCFMQSTKLVVDTPNAGECERPQKTSQELTDGVADHLNCPLGEYIYKLESYRITSSIQWYKVSFIKSSKNQLFFYFIKQTLVVILHLQCCPQLFVPPGIFRLKVTFIQPESCCLTGNDIGVSQQTIR